MLYAYIDEAANLADTNQFFIIAVVSTQEPKNLERILKRARLTILEKKKREIPELKFSRVIRRVAHYIIQKIAKEEDVAIYVWVIDKEGRRVEDTPQNYGLALAHVLRYGFAVGHWDTVWVDEKYTKERDQQELRETLQASLGSSVMKKNRIIFAKSEREPGLGVADFIAGAFYIAYNRNDRLLKELLQSKVVVEEKILWRHIKQKATAPRGSVGPA